MFTFLVLLPNFYFWKGEWALGYSCTQMSKIVRQLVRQLAYSVCVENNLVPFNLWWRETTLKHKKQVVGDVIFILGDIKKTWFSIYKIFTSHEGNLMMPSINIFYQSVSLDYFNFLPIWILWYQRKGISIPPLPL